jgi:hypothetical protein
MSVGGAYPDVPRQLRTPNGEECADIRFDPEGRYLFFVSSGDAWLVPVDGGPCRLVVSQSGGQLDQGAISPSGARVASGFGIGEGERNLYVFEIATGDLQSFALPQPDSPTSFGGVWSLGFLDEHTLLTAGWGGVRRWDLTTGTHELVAAADGYYLALGKELKPGPGTRSRVAQSRHRHQPAA